MLAPLFSFFIFKLFILLFWTVFYGIFFYRQRLSSSEQVLFLGGCVVAAVLYIGFQGLELFTLLLLLIYLSAVLILFLFAFLVIPLNVSNTEFSKSRVKHYSYNSRTQAEVYSIAIVIGLGYMLERLQYTRAAYFTSLWSKTLMEHLSFGSSAQLSGSHFAAVQWVHVRNAQAHLDSAVFATRPRSSATLAGAMYIENFVTIGVVALALILVMVGTLNWLRSTTTVSTS